VEVKGELAATLILPKSNALIEKLQLCAEAAAGSNANSVLTKISRQEFISGSLTSDWPNHDLTVSRWRVVESGAAFS